MASRENMPIVFEAPFSPRDLSSIISIDTTLGVSAARTGVALVAPTNTRGDPLVMLLVGDVEMAIEPGATTFYGADGIHFTLQTSPSNTATCSNDQPPSILVARSQNATLTVNGITITFAGLVALHTTPDGGLEIALANGEARVSETLISGGSAVSALLADDGHTITGSLSAPRALSTEELELFALVADIMPLLSDENAQIAPTPTCAPHVDWPIYVVPPGETLWRIASVTGLSITELKQANCMGDQDILRAGQRFHVPRPLSPLPAAVSATSVSGATSVPGSPPGDGNSGGDNPVGQPTTAPPTCVPGTPGCDDGNIGG